jgi:hypothetical protein
MYMPKQVQHMVGSTGQENSGLWWQLWLESKGLAGRALRPPWHTAHLPLKTLEGGRAACPNLQRQFTLGLSPQCRPRCS